jgi:expansin
VGSGGGALGGSTQSSGGGSTGGAAGSGGASSGGAHTGGSTPGSGGSATGGGGDTPPDDTSGGTSAGGSGSGGTATGGSSGAPGSGGTATGGTSTGGSATGGEPEPTTPCDFGSLPQFNDDNGSATFYDPSKEVNCSFPMDGSNVEHVSTGDGAFIVAMGPSEYGGSAACGACLEVTRDNGAKVVVTVSDSCPGCQAGHIDLSRAAFMEIGTEQEGYLGTTNGGAVGLISWKYVPCPVEGNVLIALKEPGYDSWNEFMVENTRMPVTKLEVNWSGEWIEGTRQTYNYFNVGATLSFPLRVRVTDVAGNQVDGMILGVGPEEELDGQFPACK